MGWVGVAAVVVLLCLGGGVVSSSGEDRDWVGRAPRKFSPGKEAIAGGWQVRHGGKEVGALPSKSASLLWPQGGQGGGGFVEGLLSGFSIILVSEIGDETFFIAAIMAMRHPRSVVFAGSLGALAVMTVLSSVIGYFVPALLAQVGASRALAHHATTALFVLFGVRLLWIAWKAGPEEDEVAEAEEKLAEAERNKAGGRRNALRVALALLLSPIFLEAFTITFIAEWGDRSQIATIALAAQKEPIGVTLGAVAGHAIATGMAVVGGKIIAAKISQRAVATMGGILFLFWAILAAWTGPGAIEGSGGVDAYDPLALQGADATQGIGQVSATLKSRTHSEDPDDQDYGHRLYY